MYQHIQKLIMIRARYQTCLQMMQDRGFDPLIDSAASVSYARKSEDELEEACENDISFIPLNRTYNYLKESTVDFFRAEQLDEVLTNIDQTEWQEYTNQTLHQITPVVPLPRKITAQKRLPAKKRTVRHIATIFGWPISPGSFWLSSFFGPRAKKNGAMGFHNGIDMAAVKGTVVKAAAAGTVIEAHHSRGYGNTIVIQHSSQFKTRYAHLDSICVHTGQKVSPHMVIGRVGETGYIRKRSRDGSHLHFEVYDKGKRVNPLHYLPSTAI